MLKIKVNKAKKRKNMVWVMILISKGSLFAFDLNLFFYSIRKIDVYDFKNSCWKYNKKRKIIWIQITSCRWFKAKIRWECKVWSMKFISKNSIIKLFYIHYTHTHIQTPNPVKCDYSQFKRMNIEKGENKGKRNGLKLCERMNFCVNHNSFAVRNPLFWK